MCRRALPSAPAMPRVFAGAILAAAAVAAAAQTVYRCGPNGNAHSQQPCVDGREIDVSDPRSPAQLEEARQFQRREQALADQLAKDRRAALKAHPARAPAGIRSSPATNPSTKPQSADASGKPAKARPSSARSSGLRPSGQRDFVAVVPGSGRKNRAGGR